MVDLVLVQSFPVKDFKVKTRYPIARGGYGEVWDAWHARRYGRVAIKILKDSSHNDLKNEVSKLKIASDDYCAVPLFGLIDELCVRTIQGIVLEFMPCGSLDDILHSSNIRIPKHLAYRILKEISDAMNKLHKHNPDQHLLHLDLKPSNVLLDEDLHARLTDFSTAVLATVTMEHSGRQLDDNVCTYAYSPPEFFDRERRSSKYDVYSFSVMMWEILSGRKPFEGLELAQIGIGVREGDRPPINEISRDIYGVADCDALKSLIERGWDADKEQRPSFDVIHTDLRRLADRSAQNEIDNDVNTVKSAILQRLGRVNFHVNPEEYTIEFIDALVPNRDDGDQMRDLAPINQDQNPVNRNPDHQPIVAQAQYDTSFSASNSLLSNQINSDRIPSSPNYVPATPPRGDQYSSTVSNSPPDYDRRLTMDDIVRLGDTLYYSEGWQVLAYNLGIPFGQVDNITQDYPDTKQRKIQMFRMWFENNRDNGQPPLVSALIRRLREARVAVDVWQFLDPQGTIRGHMSSNAN